MIIEIVRIPEGKSPQWVRQRFVGCKFDVDKSADNETTFTVSDDTQKQTGGYTVKKDVALAALGQKDVLANEIFASQIDPVYKHLCFPYGVCEEVK